MIFQHTWRQVLDGSKTQTRRLVKEGDTLLNVGLPMRVRNANRRTRWEVGKEYAVQPGRGQQAVGRIKLLAIRKEYLHDITDDDAIAEGVDFGEVLEVGRHGYKFRIRARALYIELFLKIHGIKPRTTAFEYNPQVWVLEFELVK
jgi:hypothetical protein